jgi:hypothetical protein
MKKLHFTTQLSNIFAFIVWRIQCRVIYIYSLPRDTMAPRTPNCPCRSHTYTQLFLLHNIGQNMTWVAWFFVYCLMSVPVSILK